MDVSDSRRAEDSIEAEVAENRETHPLLNDSERGLNVITTEVTTTTVTPARKLSEPGTSGSGSGTRRRQSNNSASEEPNHDEVDRAEEVITSEPLSTPTSGFPDGKSPDASELESSFSHNHNQLKSKFDTDEPDTVEGFAHKICCNFIQCCAIFIEG